MAGSVCFQTGSVEGRLIKLITARTAPTYGEPRSARRAAFGSPARQARRHRADGAGRRQERAQPGSEKIRLEFLPNLT
jgi:hypothetical protein